MPRVCYAVYSILTNGQFQASNVMSLNVELERDVHRLQHMPPALVITQMSRPYLALWFPILACVAPSQNCVIYTLMFI